MEDYFDEVFNDYWEAHEYIGDEEKERSRQLARMCAEELKVIVANLKLTDRLKKYGLSAELTAIAAHTAAVELAVQIIQEVDYGDFRDFRHEYDLERLVEEAGDQTGVENFHKAQRELKRIVLEETDWKGCPDALLVEKGLFSAMVKGQLPSLETFRSVVAGKKPTSYRTARPASGPFEVATQRLAKMSSAEREKVYARWAEEDRKFKYGDEGKYYIEDLADFITKRDYLDPDFDTKQKYKNYTTREEKERMRERWGRFGGPRKRYYGGTSRRRSAK